MARLPRFGTAISAVALASLVAGCAAPTSRSSSLKAGKANLAYGLRASIALGTGDYATATDLAEKAAESSPQDASVRALLGNVYFASGRFASAESAYKDTLSLTTDAQILLKLALVQIAQGKNGEAISLLQSSRGIVDPSDYGLAMALAGQPGEAVQVLEEAARQQNADSRARQNLALAYALSGDWAAARTVAAQDLSADLVDARIQQWMTLAKPTHASDQVASLVGVTPAAIDPGQPVRLALVKSDTRVAEAAPVQPQVAAAEATPAPAFAATVVEPVAVAAAEAPSPAPEPVAAPAPAPELAPVATAAMIAPDAPAAFAMASSFAPKAKPAAAPKKKAPFRTASAPRAGGNSKAVVQLGAYSSEARVHVAWAELSKRYPALKNYTPQVARFDSARGTVWRLSVKGFGNQQEAQLRCQTLKSNGGSCFVRSTAGDAPVQFASR